MLLDFIDDPLGDGARWLKYGGLDTLASYGIATTAATEDALDVANALEMALPDGMLAWLRDLPMRWSSGNVHCVHASMNPDKTPDAQSENALLWGHPSFFVKPRTDGQCVIHGHTIVPEGGMRDGRISIDTGAYRGGALTAVAISDRTAQFITA
jgi:serine/threonine protein phosphatase 1